MSNRNFIPGIWEEEIKVSDFIRINRTKWMGEFITYPIHALKLEKGYDVIRDKEERFKYLVPYKAEGFVSNKSAVPKFVDEERYAKYTETSIRKKMMDAKLLIPSKKEERYSFTQPDIGAIGLYGTRDLVKRRKEYLKNMDKQFQTQEWIEGRIKHNLEIEALIDFEEFALSLGVSTRKPAQGSIDLANYFWVAALYAVLEEPTSPFSFYNIFSLLDIFLEADIQNRKMSEEVAQRITDELYCKLGAVRGLAKVENDFSYSWSLASSQINKTTWRVLESALNYDIIKIPLQLIFNEEIFVEGMLDKFQKLFAKDHPIALSQSFRKRNNDELTLTSYHTFFINYDDITFQLASLNLEKAFLIALNGGKDAETNINFQQVAKAIKPDEITFDNALEQLSTYMRFFITMYAEYVDAFAYYLDQNHILPFRNALAVEYPHYLLNIPYHRVSPIITILTAIHKKDFEVKTNEKGYISKISPKNNDKEEFIGSKINEIIHNEMKRLVYYKNGKYNVVFFSEAPFFEKEDRFALNSLSPESFKKTSLSGYHAISDENFLLFLSEFPKTSYTHIRLRKK